MGFVTQPDYEKFLKDAPELEKMLVKSAGIKIIKFYFSVSKAEQAARFEERRTNPLKQFKLSPIDQFSQKLWDRYTVAEYENFTRTHTENTLSDSWEIPPSCCSPNGSVPSIPIDPELII